MKVYELLDSNEQRQMEIIQFLLEQQGAATIREISERVGVYRNTVKDDLESLQFGLADFTNTILLEEDSGVIYLKSKGSISNLEVGYHFLKKSINYQILLFLFENGHFDQPTMAWHLGISEATLSRRLRRLNKLLKEFTLKIRNGKLEGNELQCRYFYFSLFWFGRPYGLNQEIELDDAGVIFMQVLESRLGIPFTDEGKIKMKLYLMIAQKRLELCENKVEVYFDPEIDFHLNDSFYFEIEDILTNQTENFPYQLAPEETTLFYLFIMANFSLDLNNESTKKVLAEGKQQNYFVVKLSEQVFARVEENIDVSQLSPDFMNNLMYLLFNIHVNACYFRGQLSFINSHGIDELVKQLPDPILIDLAEQLAEWVMSLMDVPEYERLSKKRYLFEYYAALVYLGYRDLDLRISIGCDFPFERSISMIFVDHIAKQIDPRIKVNIESYQKEEHYDLIITNINKDYPDIDAKQVLVLFSLETNFDVVNVSRFVGHYYRMKLERLLKTSDKAD